MYEIGYPKNPIVCGEITSDAEVALAMNPDTSAAVSEPLVNIRYALKHAQARGILTEEERSILLDLARGIYFYELTYTSFFHTARGALPEETFDRLRAYVMENRRELDVKRKDALTVIDNINRVLVAEEEEMR